MDASVDDPDDDLIPGMSYDPRPEPSALRRSSGSWTRISGQWPYARRARRRTLPLPGPATAVDEPTAEFALVSPSAAVDEVTANLPLVSPPHHRRQPGLRGPLIGLAALILVGAGTLAVT